MLLDAECTHDGSLKHLTKFDKWGWENFEKKFLNPSRLATLQALQRALLSNAFGKFGIVPDYVHAFVVTNDVSLYKRCYVSEVFWFIQRAVYAAHRTKRSVPSPTILSHGFR